MSSAQTATLGLNQWSLDDQFVMEDFNADNRKIDDGIAALGQQLQETIQPLALVKLGEVVTTANTSQIDLDLTDFPWQSYTEVQFYICPITIVAVNSPGAEQYMYVRVNGRGQAGDYTNVRSFQASGGYDVTTRGLASLMISDYVAQTANFLTNLPCHTRLCFYPAASDFVAARLWDTSPWGRTSSDGTRTTSGILNASTVTSITDASPVPLRNVHTLNFVITCNDTVHNPVYFLRGSKIIVYGVKR